MHLVRRQGGADGFLRGRGCRELEAAARERRDEERDALRGGRAAVLLDRLDVEIAAAGADNRRITLHRSSPAILQPRPPASAIRGRGRA